MLSDSTSYIVGQFKHLTGMDLGYKSVGEFHHWRAGPWMHVTRGSYSQLSFEHIQDEVRRLVNGYVKKVEERHDRN